MLDKEKNKGDMQPYLGNINVRWGGFSFKNLNQMRFEATERERYGLQLGDLVICEGGEPGRCAIWNDEIAEMKIQKALHRVRVNKDYSNKFLYYRFLLAGRNGELKRHFIGSTIKHLTGAGLKQVEFSFPPLKNQKKIADVLSSLDAKIELNNQINEELEGLAKLLYDYWFVQFDFPITGAQAAAMGKPRLEGKPYRASGGKMVYNDALKREIPVGWRDGKLEDILTLQYGKALKKEIQVPGEYPVYGSGGIYGYHNVPLVEGPGIIVGRKGTVGELHWSNGAFYPTDTSFYVEPKMGTDLNYVYFLLKRLPLKSMNSDSAVPGLSRNAAYGLSVTIPEMALVNDFGRIARSLRATMANNEKQNHQLTELRDWLLPMLMNGQVTVK
jgi:type I restriction enzyme S subunit